MADEWPEYPAATALLSDRLLAAENYSSERCQLWKENGLYAYAWANWPPLSEGSWALNYSSLDFIKVTALLHEM